jgi:hypothetical protein
VPIPTSVRLLLRAEPSGVRWTVVAANGRVLGMATTPVVDSRTAQQDFLALCPMLPEMPVTFGREHRAREWTWRVGDAESGHVARSAQAYERHATARAAFARFVAAATELCDSTPR